MELKVFVDKLFEKAKEVGFNECEVYYKDSESLSINIYKEDVEKYSLNASFGISFRGKIEGKIGYSYTEILEEDAIDMLVKSAKESALYIESDDEQFIYEGDSKYVEVNSYHEGLENISPDKLIALGIDMERESKALDERVVSFSGCALAYNKSNYGIINSKGLDLSNKANLLTAYVVPIIKNGEDMINGVGYVIANKIEDVNPKKIAKEGIEQAISKIGAESVESGKYKAVIENEAMASLLATFSGIFSGDAAQKGLSLLKGKEGEVIASKNVTILDNPHLKNGLASVSFDDEGVATIEKEIVKDGKLITLLHNLKTANKDGVKSTGNGFKASYASSIGVSPTNFYFKEGEKSIDELLKEVGDGLLITDFAGLHAGANAVTGDFSLASKGFVIKDGQKGRPVEQITVAGNFFDLLKSIEEFSNDLKFPMSSIGSPSVKVTELSIAGK